MRLLSLAARPLTGSVFVMGGLDTLRDPEPRVEIAGPLLDSLRRKVPALPDDDVLVVRLNAAAQLVLGCMLASGKAPRASAAALAATLVPTTWSAHAWWQREDPSARAQHRIQFAKDAAILGGLLSVVGDSGGRPSLCWRLGHARRAARRRVRADGGCPTG